MKNRNHKKKIKRQNAAIIVARGKIPKFVIGVDEVGRGPIAGPVYICALLMTEKNYKDFKKIAKAQKLRDSKKLSAKKRKKWFAQIKKWQKFGLLDFVLTNRSAAQIDKLGIAAAIRDSVAESIEKICSQKLANSTRILLDGALRAPNRYTNQKTIIKGDEKESIISLASIAAKVWRDKYMEKISNAQKYRAYIFSENKGYGTSAHIAAIKSHGLSDLHRKSFCGQIIRN